MKKIIYMLSVFIIFCQCSNMDWKIDHKRNASYLQSLLEEPSSSPNDRPVSRTSGVAPLAVHFFADFVHSADDDERIDRFHHYDYTWNFGDDDSATWGTTGKPKNTAKGAAAIHIFEEPGTYHVELTIKNHSGIIGTESYTITVDDPNTFYSGTNTICVNNEGDDVFTGAPANAQYIMTNNLSDITQYASAGRRILFKRGSSWTTSGLSWPNNGGPITIGAYGTGTAPDSLGIYDNAPRIIVTGGSFLPLDFKQNWRIMDLHLVDTTRTHTTFGGAISIQKILFLRLKIEGFGTGIFWTHWNNADCMRKDDMVLASCEISGINTIGTYIGSERLGLIGNIVKDARTSHVVRIWHAYRSVISNNLISGSSLETTYGSHALKMHGPGIFPNPAYGTGSFGVPENGNGAIDVKTEYCIIADNVFGSSGPWPVSVGPQNGAADERISNIIFERNRIHSDYGNHSSSQINVSLIVWARYFTIRNNIFDGSGSGNDYTAIVAGRRGVEPAPMRLEIFNNTIYRRDAASGTHIGIVADESVSNSEIKNNLVSFPFASGTIHSIEDRSEKLIIVNNLLTDNAQFMIPDAALPLDRDFNLQEDSPAIDSGVLVPVYDDLDDKTRPATLKDIGALEH